MLKCIPGRPQGSGKNLCHWKGGYHSIFQYAHTVASVLPCCGTASTLNFPGQKWNQHPSGSEKELGGYSLSVAFPSVKISR